MKLFWIQYYKDFKNNFSGFNAYFIMAIYCLFSFVSSIYLANYFVRENDVVVSYFILQPNILALIIPAITMRSWGEEIKSGTIELLTTQPISYINLVLSKFFASYSFFVLLVFVSIPFMLISNYLSIIDINLTIFNYIGLLLCGALFTAIGCLVSILNKNNILSYSLAMLILFFIIYFDFVTLGGISVEALDFGFNYKAFLSGLLYLNNFMYFIIYTVLLLWLNVLIIKYKKTTLKKERKLFWIFVITIYLLGTFIIEGCYLSFDKTFDITGNKRYTLNEETKYLLSVMDKRIDVTLYEAKNQRDNPDTVYANYAEFIERFFKLLERESNGAIRLQIIKVEGFSPLERNLINDKIPYEEDDFGNKTFMVADFSDNQGNSYRIKSFVPSRQNLLESDVVRVINSFGKEKKNIVIIAEHSQLQNIDTVKNTLEEFYNVEYLNINTPYISNNYDSVIVINPSYYPLDLLVAMDQYVLNGGSLIIFGEADVLNKEVNASLFSLLKNFGIKSVSKSFINTNPYGDFIPLGIATSSDNYESIDTVLVNTASGIETKSYGDYTVTPILKLNDDVIGTKSEGIFVSEYFGDDVKNSFLVATSKKKGKVFFFSDADLLKNFLYVSNESKGATFYQAVTFSDNLLYMLKILDDATNNNIENKLVYNKYNINNASIGIRLFNTIKDQHKEKMNKISDEIMLYSMKKDEFYDILKNQGFLSVKNIGNISDIQQKLDDAVNELNKISALIFSEYKALILYISMLIIFVIPFLFLLALAIVITIQKKRKFNKIWRLINDDKTC